MSFVAPASPDPVSAVDKKATRSTISLSRQPQPNSPTVGDNSNSRQIAKRLGFPCAMAPSCPLGVKCQFIIVAQAGCVSLQWAPLACQGVCRWRYACSIRQPQSADGTRFHLVKD